MGMSLDVWNQKNGNEAYRLAVIDVLKRNNVVVEGEVVVTSEAAPSSFSSSKSNRRGLQSSSSGVLVTTTISTPPSANIVSDVIEALDGEGSNKGVVETMQTTSAGTWAVLKPEPVGPVVATPTTPVPKPTTPTTPVSKPTAQPAGANSSGNAGGGSSSTVTYGAVGGAVAVLAAVGLAYWFYCRKGKQPLASAGKDTRTRDHVPSPHAPTTGRRASAVPLDSVYGDQINERSAKLGRGSSRQDVEMEMGQYAYRDRAVTVSRPTVTERLSQDLVHPTGLSPLHPSNALHGHHHHGQQQQHLQHPPASGGGRLNPN
jgi:hypothetical protein